MRIIAIAIAVVCSSCAQVFGIDETTPPAAATLELQRVSIGATVVTGPLDVGANTPAFLAVDASDPSGFGRITGTLTEPGHWSAAIASVAGVVYRAPDLPMPFQHELAFQSRAQSTSFVAFEHPNPQPAPAASNVMVSVTLPGLYAATEALQIVAIGAWTNHVLTGGELPAVGATAIATTIPYAAFRAMTASPPARITLQDVVLVLRYTGNTLTGQLILPPFDQTTGTDVVTGTMGTVTATTPFDAKIDPMMVASRFAAQMPKGSAPVLGWRIAAAPGYSVGVPTGVLLNGAGVAMADTTIAGTFSNPFTTNMWKPMLTYVSSGTRTFTLGGTTVTLGSSLSSLADPSPGLMLDLPAGLPTAISLDGAPLTSDGMTVTTDVTKPVDVEITADRPTNAYYDATLIEIAVVGSSVISTPVIEVSGSSPHLTLPPNVLLHGHTYTLNVACIAGGRPDAASGNLQTFALPMSVGTAASGIFTIAP